MSGIIETDVVVGLQHGDEGKGKIINWLLQQDKNNEKEYDYCIRFNGGPNAGHTVYHNDEKIVLHQIPIGIIYGVPSLIGSACVLDPLKLQKEIDELQRIGITDIGDKLSIAYNTHIIYFKHIDEDRKTDKVGSTKTGIRPTYRDKFNRCGSRIGTIYNNVCGCDIIDPVELFMYNGNNHNHNENNNGNSENEENHENNSDTNKKLTLLCEGAQGFELDIDWGDYPYCTSSNCITGFCNTTGIPPQSIRNVYGVTKIYETYVGNKQFQPEETVFKTLQLLGNEFGATTGRPRQCNWLHLGRLKRAIFLNGVTHVIINKCDILQELGVFKLYDCNNCLQTFVSLDKMKEYITKYIENIGYVTSIIFSASKNTL
tara:strand:+ start:12 stop:1127 length:1116 start_codon:yes stop_codon:yes gene_type:complete